MRLAAWSALALLSCMPLAAHDREGDFFFVRSVGADLPVWVRGNTGSGVFLVLLPGGPGTSGIYAYPLSQGFAALEQDYAVVYMDQRGAGSAQGNVPASSINLEQFVTDTDAVLATVRARYAIANLVLMGHSWGGMLGTQYLLEHPEGIDGWVEIDGAHDVKKGDAAAVAWVRARAAELIAHGERADYWRAALDWYDAHPVITNETILQHSRYAWNAMDRSTIDTSHVPNVYGLDRVFLSASDGLALLTQTAFAQYGKATPDSYWGDTPLTRMFHDVDLTPQMGRITMPALVLWGALDVVLPVSQADDALDALGSSQKSKVVFARSAHNAFDEEPAAFADAVKPFVESVR
jgi:pimeloyl-ACP methyl ester carboxylesterase